MKTINYTGNSKLIARIVHLLNRKAPLPLDGDGDAEWGTSGQVLTTDGNGNTSWTTPQGGGGDVTDVEVNGTSVVNAQGVAEVSVPTATSDLNNDSGFITSVAMNDISDVSFTNLSNGQIMKYNSTTQKWENANESGGSTYTEGDGIDITNDEISVDTTFTEASTRANIASGDSFSTILGKIKKFFTDLKTVAFTGAYSDLSGTPDLTNVAYKNANNNFSASQTIDNKSGTTSLFGNSSLVIGNNLAEGTDGNTRGLLRLYAKTSKRADLWATEQLTSDVNIYLPGKGGTLALTDDARFGGLKQSYTFPKSAAEVSGGNDSVSITKNGTAFIHYAFANSTYSQFFILVNGNRLFDDAITSGSSNLSGTTGVFSFPVFTGDTIKVAFYSTFAMGSLKLRVF